jgi:protein-tyrosine phosphatase
MAVGVFRSHLAAERLADRVFVDSAGTHGYFVGEPPDPRAQAAALRRNYDLSALRARQVQREDFLRFDHLLAMDRGQIAILHRMSPPEQRHKIGLLLDYAPRLPHREVPDPYHGSAEGFELVLDLVEAASRGLLEQLKRSLLRTGPAPD